jgi:hypothetical protein
MPKRTTNRYQIEISIECPNQSIEDLAGGEIRGVWLLVVGEAGGQLEWTTSDTAD